MPIAPITPDEADAGVDIPDFVIEVFNQLIKEKWDGTQAIVLQVGAVSLILERACGQVQRSEVFDKGWLNVEGQYRRAGWSVTYEKPAFNENGHAFFTFHRATRD